MRERKPKVIGSTMKNLCKAILLGIRDEACEMEDQEDGKEAEWFISARVDVEVRADGVYVRMYDNQRKLVKIGELSEIPRSMLNRMERFQEYWGHKYPEAVQKLVDAQIE